MHIRARVYLLHLRDVYPFDRGRDGARWVHDEPDDRVYNTVHAAVEGALGEEVVSGGEDEADGCRGGHRGHEHIGSG